MWRASEERLFERFQQRRDAASLARVFDRTAPALLRVATHLVRDRHVAEDLVQQTFVAAIEQAERWDRERGLFPWLVGILTNRARLHRRAERRAADPERLEERVVAEPGDRAADRELQAAVASAIDQLGETYRPVLTLHLFHGLNAKEIAAALGRPAGSVRTQLVRGLERLRRSLPIGLGLALTATAPAVAAIRQRVLASAAPHLDAAATGAAAATLLLGGPLMKKWLLLVPIALIGVLVYWQSAATPAGVVPEAAARTPTAATAALPDGDPDPAEDPAAAAPIERSEADLVAAGDVGTGSLVVHVAFEHQGLDAAGVWVRMRPEPWTREGPRFGERVDQAGQVRFDGIPPGRWLVEAETVSLDAKATLDVAAGDELEQHLTLDAALAVPVRVVDDMQRPVADAEVWVSMHYGGRVWPMEVTARLAGRTDVNGRTTVAAGSDAVVGARKAGHAASPASLVEATLGGEVLLMLTPGPGAIRGFALDDDGQPVPHATLYLTTRGFDEPTTSRSADGREARSIATVYTHAAADGSFALEGLLPGSYRLWGIARGVLDARLDVDVHAFEATSLRVVMRRSVPVKVRTVRPDGTPIGGLMVFGRDPQGQVVGGGSITDPNGVFSFAAPRDGYHVEIKRDQTLLAERRSEAPLTGPVAFDVVIDEHLLVRGRLLDEQGRGIAGWRIVAVADGAPDSDAQRALALAFDQRTDEHGNFELWGQLQQPLQLATSGTRYGSRGMVRRRAIAVGSDDLEIVVPTGKLPRSTLRGRVVDAAGKPLVDATVQRLAGNQPELPCEQGVFVVEGLTHGDQSLHVTAPGYGSRRLKFDLQQLDQDVGDVVLQRAVELRVRPDFGGTEWLGPLPRASFRTADGTSLWPQPTATADGDELVFRSLPPGSYVLHPHRDEQIATEPLAFELVAGAAKKLTWPVRVGRKRMLRFRPPADQPVLPDTMLTVRIVAADDRVVRDQQVKPWRGAWVLRDALEPGSYRVTATSAAGHSFAGTFDVRLDQGTSEQDMTVDVPPKR
ncbi:MAG: sigma-70 family RNA polymerase sigma factor [Planctomycetota bacterium]